MELIGGSLSVIWRVTEVIEDNWGDIGVIEAYLEAIRAHMGD